jgi:hypothetical protein
VGLSGVASDFNTLILHVWHPMPWDAFLLKLGDILPGLRLSGEMKEFLKYFYHGPGPMVYFSLS